MIGIPIIKKFVRNIACDMTGWDDLSLLTIRELIWPYANRISVMISKLIISLKFKKSSSREV
jgi:hypothetical protein